MCEARMSILYEMLYQFDKKTEILQYQLIPVYHFEITANYIYLYIQLFIYILQVKVHTI